MNRIPVFLSFDYEHDLEVKNNLVAQWNSDLCPIDIRDVSLLGGVTDHRWQTDAARAIDASRVVLVICGKNTHSAPGVTAEVSMARQRRRPVICLRGRIEGASLPRGVPGYTEMVPLDWKRVLEALDRIERPEDYDEED